MAVEAGMVMTAEDMRRTVEDTARSVDRMVAVAGRSSDVEEGAAVDPDSSGSAGITADYFDTAGCMAVVADSCLVGAVLDDPDSTAAAVEDSPGRDNVP